MSARTTGIRKRRFLSGSDSSSEQDGVASEHHLYTLQCQEEINNEKNPPNGFVNLSGIWMCLKLLLIDS